MITLKLLAGLIGNKLAANEQIVSIAPGEEVSIGIVSDEDISVTTTEQFTTSNQNVYSCIAQLPAIGVESANGVVAVITSEVNVIVVAKKFVIARPTNGCFANKNVVTRAAENGCRASLNIAGEKEFRVEIAPFDRELLLQRIIDTPSLT